MHDPKFERSVQQKMEELEFTPSEGIWTNIEKAVNHKEDRRRVPFFWFFLIPGMLLMGAGAWYLGSRHDSPALGTATTTTATTTATTPATTKAAAKRPSTTSAIAKQPVTEPFTTTRPGSTTAPPGSTAGVERSIRERERSIREGKRSSDNTESLTQAQPSTRMKQMTQPSARMEQVTQPLTRAEQTTPSPEEELFLAKRYWPGPGLARTAAPVTTAARLSTRNTNLINPSQLTRRRPWETGFAGGVGLSTFHNSPFTNLFATQRDAAMGSYAAAPSNGFVASGAPSSKNEVSDIRPGLSFWAGIIARKPLSSRWAFTAGLNLHYYSSELRTGYQVSYPAQYNATYLSGTSSAALIQSYPYYATGNEQSFINRYYFLEIPATVQWQINHSRTLPLFWEGGASLSYLMSSNALYYDKSSGVYYKDSRVTNRTQVSLATSLLLGIPVGGARLQVGPQIQYGITNMLDLSSSGNPQHLFYGGLRIILIPAGQRRR